MGRLKNLLPLKSVKVQYGFLITLEILLTAFIWWYFIWGFGHKVIFLAVTVFMSQVAVVVNNFVVALINRPRKSKEDKKKEAQKKTSQLHKRLRH